MGIYINDDELRVMRTISPAARCAYIWLRTRMDWRTGLVGRVTSISRYALGEDQDYEVPKGRGTQLIRIADTTTGIKEAAGRLLDVLERVGLLVKRACAVLTFFCPLASLQASVRPNQTDHKRTTPLYTKHTTHDDREDFSIGAGFDGFYGYGTGEPTTPENEQNTPNAPHIIGQGNTSTPQSSSTDSTGVGVGFGENAGGLNRDRATPSQAVPLGRTGEGEEGSYRDRATPSRAGQLSQPGNTHTSPDRDRASPSEAGGPAQPLGALPDQRQNDALVGFPENESAPPNTLSAPISRIETLVKVLNRRAVRVPTKPDVLQGWVAMGVTPLELDTGIERALAERVKAGSQQRLNVGYVASIIQTARSEARMAADAARQAVAGRRRSDTAADMEALARQLGIAGARPGESLADFRIRVLSAAGETVGAGRE